MGFFDLGNFAAGADYLTPEQRAQASTNGWLNAAANLFAGSNPQGGNVGFGQAFGNGLAGYMQGTNNYMTQLPAQGKALQDMQYSSQLRDYYKNNPNAAQDLGVPTGMPVNPEMLQKLSLERAKTKNEYTTKLQYEPLIAGQTEMAKNPALMARDANQWQNKSMYQPQIDAASKAATLPYEMKLKQFENSVSGNSGQFKNANILRDEHNSLTKDFRVVNDAYNKIKSTSDTGPGDMSMLYQYVKLLDPGSVVRESEFATAAASGSYGDRIQGAVKSIMEGGRLPKQLREQFMAESDNVFKGQKIGYDNITRQYKGLASRYNLPVEDVVIDSDTSQGIKIDDPVGYQTTPSGTKYRVIK